LWRRGTLSDTAAAPNHRSSEQLRTEPFSSSRTAPGAVNWSTDFCSRAVVRAGVAISCMIAAMSTSLVILGCSQRKRQTSRVLPAIERYDGPVFRVLRKHSREAPETAADACILSARFGLIRGKTRIPRYDLQVSSIDPAWMRQRIKRQLARALGEFRPKRLFVSVGNHY